MKIAAARIEATLLKPGGPILLLYGEDAGLVRMRASQAMLAAAGKRVSPFQVSTLLKEEHGRLMDEASSIPLDGTRRIVRVQDASDNLLTPLSKLADAKTSALIILEAGALTPRSKLRVAAEKGVGWAAIACYPDTIAAIATHIRRSLAGAGLSIQDEAVQYLSQELSGDSSRRERELDKLVVYATGSQEVSLEDATACCIAENEFASPLAFTAAMLGQVTETDDLLAAAEWDGVTGPGLLAGFAGHLHRLLRVRLMMDGGMSGDEAGRAQRPPLYPRQLAALLNQVTKWDATELAHLLSAVSAVDAACKRAATRDLTMASKIILDAARYASRR